MRTMLSLRPPSPDQLDRFMRQVAGAPLNTRGGLTEGTAPRYWFVDDVDAILGVGPDAFDAAVSALQGWDQVALPWFRMHRPADTPIERGSLAVYSARIAGIWMTYACRIVSVIDDSDAQGSRRFGFVWATVGAHGARGEERFLVWLDAQTGEVHGSIRAVSRPARWYTWVGLPVARRSQRLFKPEALAALARAVRRHVTT